MAYGLKYSSTFYQVKTYSTDGEWKINIYLEGYGGSVTEIDTVRDSIKLTRSGDFEDVIRPTTLEFSVYNKTEGQFLEFADASWGDYKIELIFDPNGTPLTKYVGYNQTDLYTEPMEQTPYPSALKFTDGLKHLEYVRFSDSSNDLEETSKNANSTATVSASIPMSTITGGVIVNIDASTGTNLAHIVTLQTSADDAVWVSTTNTIEGVKSATFTGLTANYVRLKVTTAEGAVSTVDWSLKPIYTGQKAIIETLRLALNNLPSPIGVRDIVNVYEDSINSAVADSMLAQIYTDAQVYKEDAQENGEDKEEVFMCNKVIEEILKPLYCQIYQSDGIWYIVRKQEYRGTNLVYRDFNANVGTESTLTVASNGNLTHLRTINNEDSAATDIVMPSASAEKEVIPPINRLKVTFDQQTLDYVDGNLVKNSDFWYFSSGTIVIDSIGRGSIPNDWSQTGVDTNTYFALNRNVFFPNDSKRYVGFQFDPDVYRTSRVFDPTIYISQSKSSVPISTSDTIKILMNHKIRVDVTTLLAGASLVNLNNWLDQSITVVSYIYLKLGSYYLAGNNLSGYAWSTTEQNALIILKGSDNLSRQGTSFIYYGLTDVDTPALPTSAIVDFEYRLYQPFTDVPSFNNQDPNLTIELNYIEHTNLGVMYQPDDTAADSETIIYADINEDENVEEIEVIHGDGSTISQGSYRIAGGVTTDAWQRRGETESLDILTILINSIRDDNGGIKDQLNAKLIGEFDFYNSMSMTIGAITKKYILDSYTYNLESNEWDTTLIEIHTFTELIKYEPVGDFATSDNTPPPIPKPIVTPRPDYRHGTRTVSNYTGSVFTTADQTNLTDYSNG